METHPNAVKDAYANVWMVVLGGLFCSFVLSMPTISGFPLKYTGPVTLFLVRTVFTFIGHRTNDWLRRFVINATVCFVVYAILAVLESKHWLA